MCGRALLGIWRAAVSNEPIAMSPIPRCQSCTPRTSAALRSGCARVAITFLAANQPPTPSTTTSATRIHGSTRGLARAGAAGEDDAGVIGAGMGVYGSRARAIGCGVSDFTGVRLASASDFRIIVVGALGRVFGTGLIGTLRRG